MTKVETRSNKAEASDSLPSLIGRLGEDLSRLVDLRLTLFKVEIKEDLAAFVRRAVIIATGAAIAMVGFVLLNVALAFLMSTIFADVQVSQPAKYALGFVVTGLGYLVLGGIVVIVTRKRLARQGLVPTRSVNEFEKDKDLIKTVMEG